MFDELIQDQPLELVAITIKDPFIVHCKIDMTEDEYRANMHMDATQYYKIRADYYKCLSDFYERKINLALMSTRCDEILRTAKYKKGFPKKPNYSSVKNV